MNLRNILKLLSNYFYKPSFGFIKFNTTHVALPKECIVCCSKVYKDFSINKFYDWKYRVFYFSCKTLSFPAPVCKSHYWQLHITRILSLGLLAFSFFWSFIFFPLFILAIFRYYNMKSALKIVRVRQKNEFVEEMIISSNREDFSLKLCRMEGAEVI